MKYLVKMGFCVSAGRDVYPGEVVDLDPREAAQFGEPRLVPAPEDVTPAPAEPEAAVAPESPGEGEPGPQEPGQGAEGGEAAATPTGSAVPPINGDPQVTTRRRR